MTKQYFYIYVYYSTTDTSEVHYIGDQLISIIYVNLFISNRIIVKRTKDYNFHEMYMYKVEYSIAYFKFIKNVY